jgi:hypothetical protein
MREISFKYRQEIDNLQKELHDFKIKVAELNIIVDTQKSDNERLFKENDSLVSY